MSNVNLLGQSYVQGVVAGDQVITGSESAALAMRSTDPGDESLRQTRLLLHGMFAEYTRAIQAREAGATSNDHMLRAYTLADSAHVQLQDAEHALNRLGCDVSSLL